MSVKSSIKKVDELTLDAIGSDRPVIYEDVKFYYDNNLFASWKAAMIVELDELVDGLYLFNALDSENNKPLPFFRDQTISDLIDSIVNDFETRGNFYLLQCIPNIKYERFIYSLPDDTISNHPTIVGKVVEHLTRKYPLWNKKYVTKS